MSPLSVKDTLNGNRFAAVLVEVGFCVVSSLAAVVAGEETRGGVDSLLAGVVNDVLPSVELAVVAGVTDVSWEDLVV